MEHFGNVNCLEIVKEKMAEGCYLSTGSDVVICISKRGSGEFSGSLRQGPNAKAVTCLAVKGNGVFDGSRVLSGAVDGTKTIVGPQQGQVQQVLAVHINGPISCVSWGNEPGTVVSGGADGQIRTWDVRLGRCSSWVQAHSAAVTKFVVDPMYICSASRDGTLRVWPTGAGEREK